MRNKLQRSNDGQDNWLTTYGDMVTLLLCFFVLLYSMSTIDADKWTMLVKAFNKDAKEVEQLVVNASPDMQGDKYVKASGNANETGLDNFDSLYWYLQKYVEDKDLESYIELSRGETYAFIVFKNNIFFDGDSDVLKSDGAAIIDYLCEGLAGISDQIGEVRILGHTTQAHPTRPNNVEGDRLLSSNRAVRVLIYMQEKNIIEPQKLISVGYGQHYPISPFDTEENRSKNRRVEILITKNDAVKITLQEVYEDIENNPE